MPLNDALLNIGANAMAAAAPYLALHTAQPDTNGSNQSTAARVAAAWPGAATGDLTITNKAFSGGAANGPCTYVGFWSASSGGIFYGYVALNGDQAFSSGGTYTILSLAVNGSST